MCPHTFLNKTNNLITQFILEAENVKEKGTDEQVWTAIFAVH